VSAAQAQDSKPVTSGNPVFPGWYADPEATIFDNQYWIYPTYSAPYKQQVFMDAFSSPDLVTWTKHSRIIDTNAVKWAYMAMWAPAIVHKDSKYYLFFGANDIQDAKKQVGGIGVGVSDRPEGPYSDYLGKPLLSDIVNGAQPIDQFVFKDKDDQYYMIYGGWGHCNIVKLKSDFTGLIPFEDKTTFKEITPEGYVEGPVMFLRNIISCGRRVAGAGRIIPWPMPSLTRRLVRSSGLPKCFNKTPPWLRGRGIIPSYTHRRTMSGISSTIAVHWGKPTQIIGSHASTGCISMTRA
jgi:hypothetical protein